MKTLVSVCNISSTPARHTPHLHRVRTSSWSDEHLDKALAASELDISDDRKLAMRLGALLHDADDYKYFPKESKNGENIMR